MSNSPVLSLRSSLLLGLVALLGAGALFWANYQFAVDNPGGNDFLPRWVGTRAFFQGRSPYAEEVALEIQMLIYGHPAYPGQDESRFAYPLYSVWVFAPFALFANYTTARAVWMTALEISSILLAIVSLRLTAWKPSPLLLALFLLFAALWYHGLRSLINGNAVTLVALWMTLAVWCIGAKRDAWAGLCLALTTIKPQLALLLVAWTMLWALSQRRWKLIGWTAGIIGGLVALAFIFIPTWIQQELADVSRYPLYTEPGSPLVVFQRWWPNIGPWLGWGLIVLLAVILLSEWRNAWGKPFAVFVWTTCLTLVISQWIGIQTDPSNFTILFLPLVLVLAQIQHHGGQSAPRLVAFILVLVLVGLWVIFLATLGPGANAVQNPIMFFPLPLLLLGGLYRVRRWVFESAQSL